jgi:hypothetical protein
MASNILVLGAAYGSKTAGVDVTQIVQDRLDAGNDDVIVNNAAFGDPHPGELKRFGIVYQRRDTGEKLARCATENERFELVD